MLKTLIVALSVALLQQFSSPSSASAIQLFLDDFSADPSVVFGQTNLANWTVVRGNVDVVADCAPAHPGNCLDLDGSFTYDLTLMQTKTEFLFESGVEYRLLVNIPAVNPDLPNASHYDGLQIAIGSMLLEIRANGTYDVPLLIDRTFTPTADEYARIVIELLDGRDFVGPLLNRVELQRVPEPTAALLTAVGFLHVGLRRRPMRR